MKKDRREILRAMALLTQIGITIAVCILGGVLLGKFLDNLFGSSPWLLLIFSLLGAATGFKVLFDLLKGK